MKKCNNCGKIDVDPNAIACPDCGDDQHLVAMNDNALDASGPALLPVPESSDIGSTEVAMPSIDMSMDQRPVVATITLPDGSQRELRDGDALTVANDRYDGDVDIDVRLPDDEKHAGVSGTEPFYINVENGKVTATGGGGNGFKVITSQRHKAEEVVEVNGGNSVVLGRSTVLRVS